MFRTGAVMTARIDVNCLSRRYGSPSRFSGKRFLVAGAIDSATIQRVIASAFSETIGNAAIARPRRPPDGFMSRSIGPVTPRPRRRSMNCPREVGGQSLRSIFATPLSSCKHRTGRLFSEGDRTRSCISDPRWKTSTPVMPSFRTQAQHARDVVTRRYLGLVVIGRLLAPREQLDGSNTLQSNARSWK
jgi:hypothetical protein